MEYITLQNSKLVVSRLCMGGCPMGGHGWGNVVKEDVIGAIHYALDEGIQFFDTADIYGLGKSEEILGKALLNRRNNAVIATKFGVRIEQGKTIYDNSKNWINKALNLSLKRLHTDYVDLYQIHYLDGITPIEDIIEVLEDRKQKGDIRYYGLSNISMENEKDLLPYQGYFVSFQNEYSLACRNHEGEMLSLARNLHLTPMTWGSLGQGILSGKYNKDSIFEDNDRRSRSTYVNFHGDKLIKNLAIVEVMKQISNENARSLTSIALRFILDYMNDSVVIVGIKNKEQLASNQKALGWSLEKEQLERLIEISS